jgi:hypothetical protein
LLRALASILLDDQLDETLAVALTDECADSGAFDLFVRALPLIDPIGSLYGFRAPAAWDAFGVVASGTAQAVDRPGDAPRRVRVVHLLDRHGIEVSMAKAEGTTAPMIVDLCGAPDTAGRVPDTCRRVLGLPTRPPTVPTAALWAVDWLDRVLAEVLGRDLGAPPLSWPAVERLHRRRDGDVAPWSILRRECAAGQLTIGGVTPAIAAWMDDGLFSRQVIAAYPELHELVADLADLLPAEVWRQLVDRIEHDQHV